MKCSNCGKEVDVKETKRSDNLIIKSWDCKNCETFGSGSK